jgi:hypothetical protein
LKIKYKKINKLKIPIFLHKSSKLTSEIGLVNSYLKSFPKPVPKKIVFGYLKNNERISLISLFFDKSEDNFETVM